MDLLASLQMDDLPEHQTRTVHLMAHHPDFSLRLGFDACCICGTKFSPGCDVVKCKGCKRISYCSEKCLQQDASMSPISILHENAEEQQEEQEQALGHSSVICALLKLCNDDEAIDRGEKDLEDFTNAALDRVRSEYESYPATLANIINQGPCFQPVLQKCSQVSKSLSIHVVGASEDAELQKYPFRDSEIENQNKDLWDTYAEAMGEMVESRGFGTIELSFIGPDCPKSNVRETKHISAMNKDNGQSSDLIIRTYRGEYKKSFLDQENISKPDVVVFFNPGFTCPDYQWVETLRTFPKYTPFLATTNTELEGIADCQYLLEQDLITSVPVGLADILGIDNYGSSDDNDGSFFDVNPFSGNRVRQSATMANDLYLKNRWMFGGIFNRPSAQPPNKKKRSMTPGSLNTKANNPALV